MRARIRRPKRSTYVTNATPQRVDPTRTGLLRRNFAAAFRERWDRIKVKIIELVSRNDSFGLDTSVPDPFVTNAEQKQWAFRQDADKVKAFQEWLQSQFQVELLGPDDQAVWTRYVEEGVKAGALRAFDDANRVQRTVGSSVDFYGGSRAQFLRDAFANPVAMEKVKLLAGRVFTDLKGVTEATATQMTRVLADGLSKGQSPRVVGAALAKVAEDIGKARAVLIARTETIRAHADGQLMAYEAMGVEEISLQVEWVTAKKGVCPLCSSLDGVVLKLNEARGMIPRHPGCRCAWAPANVGESTAGQKRTKPQITDAINKSNQLAGKGNQTSPGAPIASSRPEPVLNCACYPQLDILSTYILNKGGGNCGTGAGGFKPGNTCAIGGAGGGAGDKAKFIGATVGAAEHAEADRVSNSVAKAVGGVVEEDAGGPGQKDKKPFDVRANKSEGVGFHDIEVKSLLKGGKQVISVHDDALLRKVEHQKANPNNVFHTVVVDRRKVYQGGAHSANYSGHEIYYKRGSGRYTLKKMHKVKDMAELRTLINTPSNKLPENARGKLPPPPPVSKLKESAAKAAESRKIRDKARKLRNADKLREQARLRAELAKAKK